MNNDESKLAKETQRMDEATKLIKTPSQENCIKVMRLLEEIEQDGASNPSLLKKHKKDVLTLFIMNSEQQCLECYASKQYSLSRQLYENLSKFILHYAEDLDIGRETMMTFITDFMNMVESTGLERITFGSGNFKKIKVASYNKAVQILENKTLAKVLETLVTCLMMTQVIEECHKNES